MVSPELPKIELTLNNLQAEPRSRGPFPGLRALSAGRSPCPRLLPGSPRR